MLIIIRLKTHKMWMQFSQLFHQLSVWSLRWSCCSSWRLTWWRQVSWESPGYFTPFGSDFSGCLWFILWIKMHMGSVFSRRLASEVSGDGLSSLSSRDKIKHYHWRCNKSVTKTEVRRSSESSETTEVSGVLLVAVFLTSWSGGGTRGARCSALKQRGQSWCK